MARAGVLLAAAAFAASALALHCLTVVDAARPLAVALSWGGAALLAIGCARAAGVGIAESATVAGLLALALYLGAGTRYAVFLPSLAVHLLLAWFFGRTLAAGRIPLVTEIARFVRGTGLLAPELERYTRRATWAWCLFFVAMAAISAALAAFAPLAAWSIFANVLAAPLVAAMFAAEYAYRRRRLVGHEHVPPLAVLRRLLAAGFTVGRPAAK
jgi:uncharacterized membrane protein